MAILANNDPTIPGGTTDTGNIPPDQAQRIDDLAFFEFGASSPPANQAATSLTAGFLSGGDVTAPPGPTAPSASAAPIGAAAGIGAGAIAGLALLGFFAFRKGGWLR